MTLRLGIVGCGRVVEAAYVPALAGVRAFHLVAVADRDDTRAGRVAAQAAAAGLGAPRTYADLASLLDGSAVDALVLATPPGGRLEDVARATASGATVLVEKPPALDGDEAATLAALDPWIGFNRRFDPGVGRLRRAGEGRVGALDLTITYRRAAWGAYAVDVEAVLDLGPHVIDLARWLTGREITEVDTGRLDHDRAELDLKLGDARARLRVATDRIHHESFELRATNGEVLGRHRLGGVGAAIRSRLGAGSGASTLVESFTAQMAEFAVAAGGGSPERLATAQDGWAVMAAVDAARASRSTGRPAAVKAAPAGPHRRRT